MSELDDAIQQAITNMDEPEEVVLPDDSSEVEPEAVEVETEPEVVEVETEPEVTEDDESTNEKEQKLIPIHVLHKEREKTRYYRELAEQYSKVEVEIEPDIQKYDDPILERVSSRLEYLESIDLSELNEFDSQELIWKIEDYQEQIENRKIEIAKEEQEKIKFQESVQDTFNGFVKDNGLDENQAGILRLVAMQRYGNLSNLEDALTKAYSDIGFITKAKEPVKSNAILENKQKLLQKSIVAPKGTIVTEDATSLDDAINLAMKNLNIN